MTFDWNRFGLAGLLAGLLGGLLVGSGRLLPHYPLLASHGSDKSDGSDRLDRGGITEADSHGWKRMTSLLI